MIPAPRQRPSLAQHYLRWLVSLFLALAALMLAAVLGFVMLPLAERSADDLAALMVLSAKTWAESPPDARLPLETELLRDHQLAVQPGPQAAVQAQGLTPPGGALIHGFYVHFLEQALQRRSGVQRCLVRAAGPEPGDWLWSSLDMGGQKLRVGLAEARMSTRPLWGLAVVLVGSVALASIAALWLARRIARPVAQLEQAAADLATGASPALLAQTGPRELADLAAHFNRMARQVQDLLDGRTTLLAGISHDLRTPLARMRLALELLTIKPSPALLKRLERDIEEMNALIGQTLDLAKGLQREDRQRFQLAPWLVQRMALHAELARGAGASVAVNCGDALQVYAAAGPLGRVLDNLLANALRYAPGPVELVAQAAEGPLSGHVRISVLDRGPGIPADELAVVWRPFHRLETSRNAQTGGYGLGLAVVKQLAQVQGWAHGLSPRPGGGLQAWVDVPAAA